MEIGLTATFAAAVVAFVALSRRFDRWLVGAPIAFTAFGVLVRLLHAHVGFPPQEVHALAELTLALVLFHDAGRVQPRAFRRDWGVFARLLLVGLPLTMVVGYFTAAWMFPGVGFALWLLLASSLAPTDAGLGAVTVLNPVIPVRIRRILNVESGLNDGLSTPVVLVAIAAAGAAGGQEPHVVLHSLGEIGIGVLVGIGAGVVAGAVLTRAARRGWADIELVPLAGLVVPMFTYYGAVKLHGNGFVAAFVSGVCYAAALNLPGQSEAEKYSAEGDPLRLTEDVSTLLSYAVWAMFGVSVVDLAGSVTWTAVGYAVLSLTVIRMVPVALVLLGTGFKLPTVAFVGWFGPRGLASVIFSLIAVETLPKSPQLDAIVGTISVTVLLSVVLHGMTSGPFARRYGDWVQHSKPPAELGTGVEPEPGRARVTRAR